MPKKVTEAAFLEMFQAAVREQRKPSAPSKRSQKKKVGRLQSTRMRAAQGFTRNTARAIFQEPETLQRVWDRIAMPPARLEWVEGMDGLTRNVGPSDLGPCSPGKATTSR